MGRPIGQTDRPVDPADLKRARGVYISRIPNRGRAPTDPLVLHAVELRTALEFYGRRITQDNLAGYLNCEPETVRRWFRGSRWWA
jgi:hypothetical protein